MKRKVMIIAVFITSIFILNVFAISTVSKQDNPHPLSTQLIDEYDMVIIAPDTFSELAQYHAVT